MLEQAEHFIEKVRGQKRCDATVVIRRRYFDKIGTDEFLAVETARQLKNLIALKAAHLGSSGSRRKGWIEFTQAGAIGERVRAPSGWCEHDVAFCIPGMV